MAAAEQFVSVWKQVINAAVLIGETHQMLVRQSTIFPYLYYIRT